jgi:predicted SAM-dependent methyltransferase
LATIGAFDVLEHLEKPELLLDEIYRVLMPGGTFVCSVPAYQWLFSDFDIFDGTHGDLFASYWNPHHFNQLKSRHDLVFLFSRLYL